MSTTSNDNSSVQRELSDSQLTASCLGCSSKVSKSKLDVKKTEFTIKKEKEKQEKEAEKEKKKKPEKKKVEKKKPEKKEDSKKRKARKDESEDDTDTEYEQNVHKKRKPEKYAKYGLTEEEYKKVKKESTVKVVPKEIQFHVSGNRFSMNGRCPNCGNHVTTFVGVEKVPESFFQETFKKSKQEYLDEKKKDEKKSDKEEKVIAIGTD